MRFHQVIVLLMTILSAVMTAAVLLEGPAAVTSDAQRYWQLGESVATGDWLLRSHPIAYRTPGYPWFIAICQVLAGSHSLAMIVVLQGAMHVMLVPIGSWIAARLAGEGRSERAAMAAAVLTAVGISRLYFARAVLSESPFLFVMMLHVACIAGLATSRAKMRWACAAGWLLGATVLVRPVGQWLWLAHLFLWIPVLWQTSEHGARRLDRRLLKSLVAMAVIAVLVISPWWARNVEMFGRLFITEFVGRNVWIVTFQDQAGAGLPLPATVEAQRLRRTVEAFKPEADLTNTWDVSEGLTDSGIADDQADRLMKTVAAQAAERGLGRWAERFGRRLVNFFRCVSDEPPRFTTLEDLPRDQRWWRVPNRFESVLFRMRLSPHLTANMVVSGGLMIAWLTLFFTHRYRWVALWLAAMIGYFAVVTAAIEIPAYRYRMVIEPLMGIIGGIAVAGVISRGLDRQR